ncbi:MAG: hypothetical protein GOP50_06520 [Candidatus Heimdallarchaeota archaeon]|nr:hypothetical protein [Candidatus Heimdallarchaeota archaeon]
MKLIFKPVDKQQILNQLQKIAPRYNTQVRKHDTGDGHFIFVKSRIKISEKLSDNVYSIHVWGANEEDLSFLKQVWGEPSQVLKERLTPIEFANELADFPSADNLSKSEIIQTLDMTEKEYNQFERLIQRTARRPNASIEMKRAFELLKKAR